MNWLKSITIIVALALGFSAQAQENGAEQLEFIFEQANSAYKDGNIEDAKAGYRQILDLGYASAKVYFNLGNCYYKEQSFASALLFFERAKRLSPDDEDILHNLAIAQTHVTDKVEPLPTFFVTENWHKLSMAQSPDTWSVIFILFLSLTCAAFSVFLISKQRNFKQAGFSLALIFFVISGVIIALAVQANTILAKPEAIVFDGSVSVKSEPHRQSTDQFVIHEGLKVEVLQEEESWTRIRLENGNSGWIPDQSIQRI